MILGIIRVPLEALNGCLRRLRSFRVAAESANLFVRSLAAACMRSHRWENSAMPPSPLR
jgi:hypothetical protein